MVLAILDAFVDAEDGAYAIDMQQRVVYWNRAAQRILGYAPSEALGKRCFQVFWGAGMDLGQECSGECFVVQRARAGKIAPCQTILARSKAGQTKWLSIVHVLLPAEASSGSACSISSTMSQKKWRPSGSSNASAVCLGKVLRQFRRKAMRISAGSVHGSAKYWTSWPRVSAPGPSPSHWW